MTHEVAAQQRENNSLRVLICVSTAKRVYRCVFALGGIEVVDLVKNRSHQLCDVYMSADLIIASCL